MLLNIYVQNAARALYNRKLDVSPFLAMHPVKRKQKDGSTLMVDCPSSIVAYNKYMGGVDRGDQLRSYYHVRLKLRKYVFWFLFDVVVTNSYILSRYAITTNPAPISKQSLKNFRLKLASQLIGSYCSRVRLG